jgi:endonuclease G
VVGHSENPAGQIEQSGRIVRVRPVGRLAVAEVNLPPEFCKVLACATPGPSKARAFLVTQDLDHAEALELDQFRAFQVALPGFEARTGCGFPEVLRDADTFAVPQQPRERAPLATTDDIRR